MARSFKLAVLAGGVVALCGARRASAVPLYTDPFDDVAAGASINGRTPPTSFNSAKWIGPSSTIAGNGSGGLTANTANSSSAGFDLGANYLSDNPGVYTVSADLTEPAGTAQSWVGVGFAKGMTSNGNLDPSQHLVNNNGAPWVIFRQNGQVIVFGGPGNANALLTTATGAVSTDTPHTFRLSLDTSAPQWTLDAYIDGVQQDLNGATAGNTYTFATNPTGSHYVALSTGNNGSGALATIDNFSVTGPVAAPEPGTAGVLALAGATTLGRRRLRRRAG